MLSGRGTEALGKVPTAGSETAARVPKLCTATGATDHRHSHSTTGAQAVGHALLGSFSCLRPESSMPDQPSTEGSRPIDQNLPLDPNHGRGPYGHGCNTGHPPNVHVPVCMHTHVHRLEQLGQFHGSSHEDPGVSGHSCLATDCPEEAGGGSHPGSGSVHFAAEAVLFWKKGRPPGWKGHGKPAWVGREAWQAPLKGEEEAMRLLLCPLPLLWAGLVPRHL